MAFTQEDRKRLLIPDFTPTGRHDVPEGQVRDIFASDRADSLLHYLMLVDLETYLPGDLLTLTDRISMSQSLEVRVPFLDHPLVELMARIPPELKVHGWAKKRLFKKALAGILPYEILHRKKLGFSVPLALWLRTDLASMMQDVLSEGEIKRVGYLNYSEIRKLMTEHLCGHRNHENKLWALINLVHWHRTTDNYV